MSVTSSLNRFMDSLGAVPKDPFLASLGPVRKDPFLASLGAVPKHPLLEPLKFRAKKTTLDISPPKKGSDKPEASSSAAAKPSAQHAIPTVQQKIQECTVKLAQANQELQTKLEKMPDILSPQKEELAKELAMRAQVNQKHIPWKELTLDQKKAELEKLGNFEKRFAAEIASVMEKGIRGYHCAFKISTITRARNDYNRDVITPMQKKIALLEAQKVALENEQRKLEEQSKKT
jgi:hypothetical protein